MANLPATTQSRSPSLLMDVEAFNHMQRVGKMLALSPLFPEHLRKGSIDTAVANGVLVMNMAARLNEDPLTIAQNIYFVGGKPGWSTSYMIAKANQHGVFRDPIDWELEGEGDTLAVTAFGVLERTGKRVEVTCDMAMAKAEGWTKNTKYQSMPKQMLRYRSATALIRLYCPEVMVGVPAQIEVETGFDGMRDITPREDVVEPKAEVKAEPKAPVEAVVTDAQEEAGAKRTRHDAQKDFQRQQKAAALARAQNGDQDTMSSGSSNTGALDLGESDAKAGEADDERGEQLHGLFNSIIEDIADGTHPDEIEEIWAAQIEMIEEALPVKGKELRAKLAEARAKLDG